MKKFFNKFTVCVMPVFWISVSSVFYHQKPGDYWPRVKIRRSWVQYTFSCSQTSETCYFWDQFLAACDTSLLSRSTCCVEKWPERSESVCSTHCLSVNFAEVHRVWLWWNQSVWTSGLSGWRSSWHRHQWTTEQIPYQRSLLQVFFQTQSAESRYLHWRRQLLPELSHFVRHSDFSLCCIKFLAFAPRRIAEKRLRLQTRKSCNLRRFVDGSCWTCSSSFFSNVLNIIMFLTVLLDHQDMEWRAW